MKSSNDGSERIRVELKYCEHCGGLWIREGGAGVYCQKCEPKVADLPIPKKRYTKRAILPVQRRTVVEDYDEIPDEGMPDLEAARGVA